MDEPLTNVEPIEAGELRPIDLMVLAGAVAVARCGERLTLANVAAALNAPAHLLGCLYCIEPIDREDDYARLQR